MLPIPITTARPPLASSPSFALGLRTRIRALVHLAPRVMSARLLGHFFKLLDLLLDLAVFLFDVGYFVAGRTSALTLRLASAATARRGRCTEGSEDVAEFLVG